MIPWRDCGKEFEYYFDKTYPDLDQVLPIESDSEFKEEIRKAWDAAIINYIPRETK